MNNNGTYLSCHMLFHTQNIRQVPQLLSRAKVPKGHQLDSVIHHSNKFTALKTMVLINYALLQTLYTKYTINTPRGGPESTPTDYFTSLLLGLITRTALLSGRRGRGHRHLAGRDRRRRPPISCNRRPRQLPGRPV